jgi:D-alanine-D-alanine ligase-like ATP-grasp enzyme
MKSVKESDCCFSKLKSLGFVKKGTILTAEAISVHSSDKGAKKGNAGSVFEIAMSSRTYVIQAANPQEMQTIVGMLQVPVIHSGFMSKQGKMNKVLVRHFRHFRN